MHMRAAAISIATGTIVLGLSVGTGSAFAAKARATKITTTPTTAAPTTTTTAAAPTTPATTAAPITTTTAAAPTTPTTAAPTTTTTAAPITTTTAVPSTTTTAAAPTASASSAACSAPAKRVVAVTTTSQLKSALSNALAGDRITLADGTYSGYFYIKRSGTSVDRIRLCGGPGAVLDGGAITAGYGVGLTANYWDLVGFTVTNSQKGVALDDGASFNTLAGLTVHHIGDEAVHFRGFSIDNVIEDSVISDTGLRDYHFGEGIYVGSAVNHWCDYSNCLPDGSNGNQVLRNRIFRTTAEAVDVKEGTTSGLVQGNTFDGTGMISPSLVDVKGNGWVVEANSGRVSPRDGFLTEIAATGWGTANVFRANTVDVQGTGYAFNMRPGNVVLCDNVGTNAAKGFSNILCSAS